MNGRSPKAVPAGTGPVRTRIFFTNVNPGAYRGERSEGSERLGYINSDGTGEGHIDCAQFDIPNQTGWSVSHIFSDRRRVLVFSIEEGMCHAETTWTHLWTYDLETQTLTPFLETNRRAPYMTFVAEMPDQKRVVVALSSNGENRHVMMGADGTGEAEEIKLPDDGFSYCLSLSPDGTRWLFHTASRRGGYRVSVMDFDGGGLTEIAGHPDHLYFAPYWSPDGEWIVFTDCLHKTDPEHHQADILVCRPDGTEKKNLTGDHSFWLAAVYGGPSTKGSGSNSCRWKPDGTEISLIDPFSGRETRLTHSDPPLWNYHPVWSPDGEQLAFCRSKVGCRSELWVMDADGGNPRFLTAGYGGVGADHAIWCT